MGTDSHVGLTGNPFVAATLALKLRQFDLDHVCSLLCRDSFADEPDGVECSGDRVNAGALLVGVEAPGGVERAAW